MGVISTLQKKGLAQEMKIHPTELMLIREGLSRILQSAARNRDNKKEKVVERLQDRLDDMEREFYASSEMQDINTLLNEDDNVGLVDAAEVGRE